jgi:hypothetical protein
VAKVFYTSGVNVAALTPMLQGGKGGNPGAPGKPGQGGAAGTPGTNVPPCIPTQASQDGPQGNSCGSNDVRGGVGPQPGDPGSDGHYTTFSVKSIPSMSGI